MNTQAILIFAAFVLVTLGITYWASSRTRSSSDFYTAGGGITGTQNGLAIVGDYMSAATLLGISSLAFTNGFDFTADLYLPISRDQQMKLGDTPNTMPLLHLDL